VVASDGKASGNFSTDNGNAKGALVGSIAGGTATGTVDLNLAGHRAAVPKIS
jgi:hypothetical protein